MKPELRLNIGRPTAPLVDIAAVPGMWALLGEDETVHLVRPEGELLRTLWLRPAPADGAQPRSLAFSRDGERLAVAGNGVWLFRCSDGKLLDWRPRPEPGLGRLRRVAFTRGGRLLALTEPAAFLYCCAVDEGWRIEWTSAPLGEAVGRYQFDVGTAGRIAVIVQGRIEFWNPDGSPVAGLSALPPLGDAPTALSFSPDGNSLAVAGADGSLRVLAVPAGRAASAATRSTRPGSRITAVAWLPGGQDLALAWNDSVAIRVLGAAEGGAQWDVGIGSKALSALAPGPDGVLYAAEGGPRWGLLDRRGTGVAHAYLGGALDFAAAGSGFGVDATAQGVRFPSGRAGRPMEFLVDQLALQEALSPYRSFSAPAPLAANYATRSWNGRTYWCGHCGSDGLAAVGVDGSLALVEDPAGLEERVRWAVPLPARAQAINGSSNNPRIVVGLADGTIRWYRREDGGELLALYTDGQRWVTWTPGGYWAASPGAEELLGCLVGDADGPGVSLELAARRLREGLRPDVIRRVILVGDEARVVAEAGLGVAPLGGPLPGQARPPRPSPPAAPEPDPPPPAAASLWISILSPADGATVDQHCELKVALRLSPGVPEPPLVLLVDGAPVARGRGLEESGGDGEAKAPPGAVVRILPVSLPAHQHACTVTVEAGGGSAAIRLRRSPPQVTDVATAPPLYLVAIGVGKYRNSALRLLYAAKDATDFAAFFKTQEGRLYRSVETRLLVDDQATKDEILEALEWLRRKSAPSSVALLFLAGHGILDPLSGHYRFLPHEANLDAILKTTLPAAEIQTVLASTAGKVAIFLDSCHAGDLLGRRPRGEANLDAVVQELASAEGGAVVFAASTGRQSSLEDAAVENGLFTQALLDGLGGAADVHKSGRVTVTALDLYVGERVRALSQGAQTPTTAKVSAIADFPLAVCALP